MNELSRPERHLREALVDYPKFAKLVDLVYQMKGREKHWPDDVLIPFGGWKAIVEHYRPEEAGMKSLQFLDQTRRLAAVGTWRYAKGVYRFNEELLWALIRTLLPETIPMRVLRRLPDWCPYLQLPEGEGSLYGYYCYLDYDEHSGARELHIVQDDDSGYWLTVALELTEGVSIQESLFSHDDKYNAKDRQNFVKVIQPVLSMLMYLCQDEPEVDDSREPGASPHRVYPKKVKGGKRLFEPLRVRTWDVGDELGQAISATAPGRMGARKSPHLRRAHWHGYWTGPRSGERTFVYRWIPPIAVAVDNLRDDKDNTR